MATSSARYVDLYDYARTAEHIDREIVDRADRLANKLSEFQAKCREPGFQVDSSLGPAMRFHGKSWEPIDHRVRTVGEAFQRADGQAGTFFDRLTQTPFGRWLFRLVRPGVINVDGLVVGTGSTYEVQSGDTLSELAEHFGVTIQDLVLANNIADPDIINPSQTLIIPIATPPSRTPKPEPVPAPTLQPPPQSQIGLFDGLKEVPNWVGERVDGAKDWLVGLIPGISTQVENAPSDSESTQPAPATTPPVLPIRDVLEEVDPKLYLNNCVKYAQNRLPWLGQAGGGAYNYIGKYKGTSFQVTDDDTDLTQHIREGYAVVWGKGVHDADADAGHVAVIEEVQGNQVKVSHTNWPNGKYTEEWISLEQLKQLVIIPYPNEDSII